MLTLTCRTVRLAALPLIAILAFFTAATGNLFADDAKPQPDVIVFSNGDQLPGKFVQAIGNTVTFHSDIVGDINVDWSKIKELHTAQKLAVLDKSVQIRRHQIPANLPIGTV